jgi:hypothetical protein
MGGTWRPPIRDRLLIRAQIEALCKLILVAGEHRLGTATEFRLLPKKLQDFPQLFPCIRVHTIAQV